jgi:hypothetical protein
VKPLVDHSFLRQLEDHDQGLQLISVHHTGTAGALRELFRFRTEFYRCLTLAPGEDAAILTAGQLRHTIARLVAAGHWHPGDPDIWIVADAGYDGPRLAHLWPACLFRYWCGCAQTVSCAGRPRRMRPTPRAGHAGTAVSSSSATRPPGAIPMPPQ